MQDDPLGREAGAQREVQLAAGGDVAPQALLREQPRSTAVQGNALEANTTSKSSWPAAAHRLDERARARAQVVLGDDVGGRAELARELDRVAAADLEVAALVHAAAERKHVRKTRRRSHRR